MRERKPTTNKQWGHYFSKERLKVGEEIHGNRFPSNCGCAAFLHATSVTRSNRKDRARRRQAARLSGETCWNEAVIAADMPVSKKKCFQRPEKNLLRPVLVVLCTAQAEGWRLEVEVSMRGPSGLAVCLLSLLYLSVWLQQGWHDSVARSILHYLTQLVHTII